MGYHRAGFEVVGVDINPQKNYPFEFIQADAMTFPLDGFDVIHASPPCQHFTKYGNSVKGIKERYEDLIVATRNRLDNASRLYVIENVERAPLINPMILCGSMFDGDGTFDIQRHRLFETNFSIAAPSACNHSIWEADRYPGGRSVARGGHSKALVRKTIEIGSWDIPLATQQWAMGISWMGVRELSQAIPPAYTEHIGRQILNA